MPYYAVAKGIKPGIYTTWSECELQVKGFSGAKFKKFNTESEANQFILVHSNNTTLIDNKSTKSEERSNIMEKAHLPSDNSWKNEDQEFLAALSALQEYPDENNLNTNSSKSNDWKAVAPNHSSLVPQMQSIKIDGVPFTMDNECFVNVYISADAENIGSWNCVAGYGVYFGVNNPLNHSEPASGRLTRNIGMILAAIKAIETAKIMNIEKLCIHTDSEFLLNAITTWIFKWKTNGWRSHAGQPVQNRKELIKLDALLNDDKINVKWFNSKGCRSDSEPLFRTKELAEIGTEEYLKLHPAKNDLDIDIFEF